MAPSTPTLLRRRRSRRLRRSPRRRLRRKRRSLRTCVILRIVCVDAFLILTSHVKVFPELQEQCANTAKCAPFQKHFAHCEEKVNAGEGFKGEDCVEEL